MSVFTDARKRALVLVKPPGICKAPTSKQRPPPPEDDIFLWRGRLCPRVFLWLRPQRGFLGETLTHFLLNRTLPQLSEKGEKGGRQVH